MNCGGILLGRKSETMQDSSSGQYHLHIKKGDIARNILLCGDVNRAGIVSGMFESVNFSVANREFVVHTGKFQGVDITVIGTGIGVDNTEICLEELLAVVKSPTVLRIGSCGTLDASLEIGDMAITQAAYRMERLSDFYIERSVPAVADQGIVNALIGQAELMGLRYRVGITATAPGFYIPQGRLGSRKAIDVLADLGVLNIEMEASAILSIAQKKGILAGAVCAVYANRITRKAIADEEKGEIEQKLVELGLKTLCNMEGEENGPE